MTAYKAKIAKEAHQDIQDAISWYSSRQNSLGRRFHAEVKKDIKRLSKNPSLQVRYDGVRCLPMKKFPYMLHFRINEADKSILIIGVLSTYLNPDTWEKRK